MARHTISITQFDFRKGMGTRENIGVMRMLYERSLEYGNVVYACFIDLETTMAAIMVEGGCYSYGDGVRMCIYRIFEPLQQSPSGAARSLLFNPHAGKYDCHEWHTAVVFSQHNTLSSALLPIPQYSTVLET